MAAQHTEGHVAAVARGLVAADATRSTTASPLRADTLDAATMLSVSTAPPYPNPNFIMAPPSPPSADGVVEVIAVHPLHEMLTFPAAPQLVRQVCRFLTPSRAAGAHERRAFVWTLAALAPALEHHPLMLMDLRRVLPPPRIGGGAAAGGAPPPAARPTKALLPLCFGVIALDWLKRIGFTVAPAFADEKNEFVASACCGTGVRDISIRSVNFYGKVRTSCWAPLSHSFQPPTLY